MSYSDEVTRKFDRALKAFNMLDGRRGVLVGYSGGADSSALLHLFGKLCAKRGICLKAVHVHHGIRGAEADRDAEHCRKTCAALGIRFELIKADIPALARESGRGIEETARDFRYAAFRRILSEDGRFDCVSTAHNADDNAETLIFNLTRGSGVDGLSGIPPVRTLDGQKTVIRPLIYCSKREITGYCSENGIEYIFDSTNNDTAYSRNFIRHEILPKLEALNPSFLDAAARLSGAARSDSAYLGVLADEFLRDNAADGQLPERKLQARRLTTRKLPSRKLANAPEPIASRAVVKLFAEISDSALEAVHIDAVLKLASTCHGEISLPDRVFARAESGLLYFTRQTAESVPDFRYELKAGSNRFESPDFAVLLVPDGANPAQTEKDNLCLKNIYKLSIHTRLNSDKINHILFVRQKRDGDSYVSGGMTRKLKKLFNDRGFGRLRRETLPVFCDGGGIVWVPGFGTADRVTAADSKITEIYYYYNEV